MSGATCEVWTRELVHVGIDWGVDDAAMIVLPPEGHPLLIGYTNYAGSSDVITPEIVGEDGDRWGTGWDALESCNHPEDSWVPAWAYSWYGGGDHWPVAVCLSCRVIHGELSSYGPDPDAGAWSGDWERAKQSRAAADAWRAAGWPKKGPPPGVTDIDEREDDDG